MRKHLLLLSAASLLLLLTAAGLHGQTLTIARGSRVCLILAEQPTPTARFAATELAEALSRTLDCQTETLTDTQEAPGDTLRFAVGPGRLAPLPELPYDHFVIRRQGTLVQLAGRDDEREPLADRFMARTGTLYAVYRFMRDHLGVRMLWTGDSGILYPRLDNIELPELDLRDGPALPIRNSYYGSGGRHGSASRLALVRWGRFNGMGCSKLGSVGHASEAAIGTELFNTHPEYYALVKGERRKPVGNRWKLCHSNPDLPELFARWGTGHDSSSSHVMNDFFPVSANDSAGWCECERCRTLDGGQRSSTSGEICVSGRMFNLANQTARIVTAMNSPKEVAIYAYAAYLEPPASIPRLEDNVLLFIARGIAWNAAPSAAATFDRMFREWSAKTGRIVLRDYRNNTLPMVIYPYPRLAWRYIRQLTEQFPAFQGINTCGDDTRAGALWGPTAYVYARLLWNPQLPLEPLLDDYYTHGWPASHRLVRAYFDFFEERVQSVLTARDQLFFPYKGGKDLLIAREMMNPETLAHGAALLAEARRLADGPEETARIDFLQVGLDAVRLDQLYYDALMQVSAFSGTLTAIPPHPDLQPAETPAAKKEAIARARQVAAERHDFLLKHREHEGIPSAILALPDARFTSDWEKTLDYLADFYSHDNNSRILFDSPWKFQIDPEAAGHQAGWASPDWDDSGWDALSGDAPWESQRYGPELYPETRGYNGWAWYRRSFSCPETWKNGTVAVVLGAVDESYDLFLNGTRLRQFRYNPETDPDSWNKPQTIELPANMLQPEHNQLTVAVHDQSGGGGIWKPSYLQWQAPDLLAGKLFEAPSENLQRDGNRLRLASGSEGRLNMRTTATPGKYTVSVAFRDLSREYHYKIPLAVRVSCKDAQGNTLPERFNSGISRANLQRDRENRFELHFEAPAGTTSLALILSLRLDQIELLSCRLTAE